MGEKVTCISTNSIGTIVGINPNISVLFLTNIGSLKPGLTIIRTFKPLSQNLLGIETYFGSITPVI